IEQHLFDLRCARGNADLMKAYCNAYLQENAIRNIALGCPGSVVPAGLNIATICPGETDPKVGRLTCNAALLKAAAIANAKRTFSVFDYPVEEFVEVLQPSPAKAKIGEKDAPLTPQAPDFAISSTSTLRLRY